jgi:hypothetical protein
VFRNAVTVPRKVISEPLDLCSQRAQAHVRRTIASDQIHGKSIILAANTRVRPPPSRAWGWRRERSLCWRAATQATRTRW